MGHQEGVLLLNRLGGLALVIGNEGINLVRIYTKIHLYYIDYIGSQKHSQLLSVSVFTACGSFIRKVLSWQALKDGVMNPGHALRYLQNP